MLFFAMQSWVMIADFILIAGMSLLFIFVVFILKSSTGISKKLLSLFFINSIFFLLYYYAYLHKIHALGAIAFGFGSGSGFLLGPVLLFYIKSLIEPARKISRPLLGHLSPYFVFFIAISLPTALSMSTGLFSEYHSQYVKIADHINLIENAYFLVYIFLSYVLIKKIRDAREQTYSFVESSNLQWISYLIMGLFVIVIVDSYFSVYELISPINSWNIGTAIAFVIIILYCFLGYKGMFQSHILLPGFLAAANVPAHIKIASQDEIESEKPVKQLDSFSSEEIEVLKIRLNELLVTKKPYLNDRLSLTEMAEELAITDKKLSELLNQHLNTNFYNFINSFRVAEVKEKLAEDAYRKYTLLSIAYDCGFQSKTSFNRVFKQKTGMSPSKYRESLNV